MQGGDWGSIVAANMADLAPDRVAGLHLNFLAVPRPDGLRTDSLTPDDQARIQAMRRWQEQETGYSAIQGTRPQTIGYALEDSPAGLAAWIVEKFRAWSDCGGDVERSFTKDQLLTNITLYWVTATATSSARLYYEMRQAGRAAVPAGPILVPTGSPSIPARSPGRRGSGRSGGTTSRTGPSFRAAAISPPWRCPTCSSPTSGSSSAPSPEPAARPAAVTGGPTAGRERRGGRGRRPGRPAAGTGAAAGREPGPADPARAGSRVVLRAARRAGQWPMLRRSV